MALPQSHRTAKQQVEQLVERFARNLDVHRVDETCNEWAVAAAPGMKSGDTDRPRGHTPGGMELVPRAPVGRPEFGLRATATLSPGPVSGCGECWR